MRGASEFWESGFLFIRFSVRSEQREVRGTDEGVRGAISVSEVYVNPRIEYFLVSPTYAAALHLWADATGSDGAGTIRRAFLEMKCGGLNVMT